MVCRFCLSSPYTSSLAYYCIQFFYSSFHSCFPSPSKRNRHGRKSGTRELFATSVLKYALCARARSRSPNDSLLQNPVHYIGHRSHFVHPYVVHCCREDRAIRDSVHDIHRSLFRPRKLTNLLHRKFQLLKSDIALITLVSSHAPVPISSRSKI